VTLGEASHTSGTDDRTFLLRAERSGRGTGRVYTVTYEAKDATGNTSTGQARVTVPKSQGR
jgi:endo-1,4-beta-xylanase